MSSFKKEFLSYRDQQIRPSFVSDADLEKEAADYYDKMVAQIGPKGLFTASHILVKVSQKASSQAQDSAKIKIDSIYTALKAGADFSEMARKYSDDLGSARNGGLLPTLATGQTVKEFEDVAYSLKNGEMSEPFLSKFGYHIILMKERSQVPPLDSLKTNIIKYLESRGIREKIVDSKLAKAFELGYTDMMLYGGYGGARISHTLANIQLMHHYAKKGCNIRMMGDGIRMEVLWHGCKRFSAAMKGDLSVICLSDKADRVKIQGLKYEYEGSLTSEVALGISNSFIGQDALIEVQDGALLLIYEKV